MSASIKLLPEHLIDQIKAGEVIERPSQLLKELVENALDASASKISIEMAEDILSYLCVKDNGKGMNYEELPLAFARHATSKINDFSDLYNLTSFGFRGEALSSVASVSKVQCQSQKVASSPARITFHGGHLVEHFRLESSPAETTESGTILIVRDLFYNTPARLKFIKSQLAEKKAMERMLQALIIANYHCSFSCTLGGQSRREYAGHSDFSVEVPRRMAQIFKLKEARDIISFEKEHSGITLKGFVARGSKNNNLMFVNGRPVQDRQLHAIFWQNLINTPPFADSFFYVIFLDLAPTQIDVNVHPAKTSVKFLQLPVILSLLSREITLPLPQLSRPSPVIPLPLEEKESMAASPVRTSSPPAAKAQVEEKTSWTCLHLFSQDFALIREKENAEIYLCHTARLVAFMLKKNRENPRGFSLPLLVSEPFYFPPTVDALLVSLEKAGIELERLDQETLVLRSLPEYWLKLSYPHLLAQLLQLGWEKFYDELTYPAEENFLELLSETSKEALHAAGILVPLSPQNLARLFP